MTIHDFLWAEILMLGSIATVTLWSFVLVAWEAIRAVRRWLQARRVEDTTPYPPQRRRWNAW